LDKDGNLYGTTTGGGTNNQGTVFALTPNQDGTWTEAVIHSFSFKTEGESPEGGVTLDSNGNLFGTTLEGGPTDLGTVFELAPDGNGGWSLSLLYDVGSEYDVRGDNVGSVFGNIGMGANLAGAVAELSQGPGGWTYNTLHSFCALLPPQCWDGALPSGPLAWDNHGNLYGATLNGGIGEPKCAVSFGCGVAFQLRPQPSGGWSYRVLYRFASFTHDGQEPEYGVIADNRGNLYGTTTHGGAFYSNGTIFELSPTPPGQWGQTTGYTETQLYTFPECTDGCGPASPLVMDQAGNLYGAAGGGNATCAGGGAYCGVIFKVSPQRDGNWKYTAIHKFSGADGFGPTSVIVGADGNLYGTTFMGGKYNLGVAFEIAP
jgi:uncharacterized repeat protein (TIGR03803 family)